MQDPKNTAYTSISEFSTWSKEYRVDIEDIEKRIDALKLASEDSFVKSIEIAVKWAALDTGAIENLYETDRGFTYSVALQTNAIEYVQNRRGDRSAEFFEDQLKAYEFILDVVTGRAQLSQAWIRELHSVICASQDTHRVRVNDQWEDRLLVKGQYKNAPNHVTKSDGTQHLYSPVDQVASEMQKLVDQSREKIFLTADPISQAAYIHHSMTVIHPFSDGNGRVSRALSSIFLTRKLGLPLVVFLDQRDNYFDALELADQGNTRVFTDLIARSVTDTLSIIETNAAAVQRPSIDDALNALKQKLRADANPESVDIDGYAAMLSKICLDELNRLFERKLRDTSDRIQFKSQLQDGGPASIYATPSNGLRRVKSSNVTFSVTMANTAHSSSPMTMRIFDILVPSSNEADMQLQLVRTLVVPQEIALTCGVEELVDGTEQVLQYKIRVWAEGVVTSMIEEYLKSS